MDSLVILKTEFPNFMLATHTGKMGGRVEGLRDGEEANITLISKAEVDVRCVFLPGNVSPFLIISHFGPFVFL